MDRVTNTELAGVLGLSHVQIHRIRAGSRKPSINSMVKIEEELAWTVTDQIRARRAGEYAAKFEEAIERYAVAKNTSAGPEERTPSPQ